MPEPDIFVTLVIEMFTTEGSTRSVMSAIDSPPARVSAGFGNTVTGAGDPAVSAAISGWICEPPDFAQPLCASAARPIPTKTNGLVNRRVIITEFPRRGLADIAPHMGLNRGAPQFIPGSGAQREFFERGHAPR